GCDVVKDKAEHEAGDDETICGTCGANICKHTYADTLSYDVTHHWYASTCGCDVIKDKTEHTWSSEWEKDGTGHWHKTECGCDAVSSFEKHLDGDDEDSRCDKCGQIDFGALIGNIDEYVSEERNSIATRNEEKELVEGYNFATMLSIKVYDNYVFVEDEFGNKKYISYCGPNNSIPFVVNLDSSNFAQRVLDFDDSSLLSFSGVCGVAAGTSVEEYLIALYNLGVGESSSNFNYICDEANSKYSFSYFYDAGNAYADVVIEFTLDEERMGVTSFKLSEQRYDYNTYVAGAENEVVYTVNQTISQSFGDPLDSSDSPNPYPASNYLFEDLVLYNKETNEMITEGCTVTIAPEYENGLTLVIGSDQIIYAAFNRYTIESNGLEAGWTNYPIFMYATKGGTYDVTISNELTSISFTVVVEYKTPTKIDPAVVIDEEKVKVKEYSIYNGLDFVLGALANKASESPFVVPSVTKGDASKITFTKDGENWIVLTSVPGEYEITLTSELDENVKAVLPLTVAKAPSAADILNRYYELAENDMGVSGSIKFIPTEDGASSGTATLKIVIAGNPMLDEPDEIWEATVSYAYENGKIVFSNAQGDDISQFALAISDRYELMLVRTPYPTTPDYTEEYMFETAAEKVVMDPSGNSFKLNVVDPYYFTENNASVFVAGEAGKYVFNLPKGCGLMIDTREKVKYFNNKTGFEFSLDLKEGQEVTFIPTAAKAGEITVYFHVDKKILMNDANGLGGKYTFIQLAEFALTFTPSDWGATSGVLTVKDPINGDRSGSFSYTIVDGDYVFSEESGIFVTKDLGGNWFFQNASLTKSQLFSGPTSYAPPVVPEIPYNGYKDENGIGGSYTVVVDGLEYKVIIVPSMDGTYGSGKLQIYDPVSGTYSEPYEYIEICNEYFFDSADIELYSENGEWLVKAEALNSIKLTDVTVEPKPQNTVLSVGSNTIKLTPNDIANGGKQFTITPTAKGEFTFEGNLDIYILYDGNPVKITGKVVLEKEVTYVVLIDADASYGEFSLNISCIKYSDPTDEPELPTDEWD
ncbi:MAG: hypothetical protein IJC80_04315, partial [Clostridia bacterium]|nr:hypothetical protein [Clostridia bacterium]